MTQQPANILIIDDDADILQTTRMVLKKQYANIFTERNPQKITEFLKEYDFDVILLDMNFRAGHTSGKEGLEWLRNIKKFNPGTQVVMITAYGDVNLAVKAMKEGATDFVVKPWDNQKLLATVTSAYRLGRSQKEIEKHRVRESTLSSDMDKSFSKIIGKSDAMQSVYSIVDKVSATDANVLILGENGTGKELIARDIHRKSARAEQVFIGVDLGALPETLFESELFGYTKGAFTDARQDKAGRFEVASGGTLFLDEIGNLSLSLQAKLLSALEKRTIYRIGSNKPVTIDVRLISATNMPLYEMINENSFREDLLYRMNTVEIHLPPLRERRGDVPLLAEYFLKVYSAKYGKQKLGISKDALKRLDAYHWPGNIRELQHVIERVVIMTEEDQIRAEHLMLTAEESPQGLSETLNIEALEKEAIGKALKKQNGNLSQAAKEVGLDRTTLYRKMEKYGI
ncbi:MAG: sigma-54 dependent transcriptional regulator [Bacteroidales bacterium]|nr:sigma-54 dependent transcriptional regulator [Bacteroidales bacterium]